MHFRPIFVALALCVPAMPALAQDQPLRCVISVLCLETNPCGDWDQVLTISEMDEGWNVEWNGTDQPTDYELIADLSAPDGAIISVRMRTLIHRNLATQAVQVLSFDDIGNITLTGQQPHIRPRAVTGFGTCESIAE